MSDIFSTDRLFQPARGLLELVYPPVCQLCSLALPAGSSASFCHECLKLLAFQRQQCCPRCAATFTAVLSSATNCPHCQDEDYAFDQVIAWGAYEKALQQIVLLIKHQEQEQLAYHSGVLLAQQFQDVLTTVQIDAVVPVPLHWSRRLWRGYNQSVTISQAVGTVLQKPWQVHWLFRRLSTPMQASVTPTQRRKNLRQAMVARLPTSAKGKHLLLVDDVMTTGATADSCARALLAAGAGKVTVLTLARAVG
jgi:ComF family protein